MRARFVLGVGWEKRMFVLLLVLVLSIAVLVFETINVESLMVENWVCHVHLFEYEYEYRLTKYEYEEI